MRSVTRYEPVSEAVSFAMLYAAPVVVVLELRVLFAYLRDVQEVRVLSPLFTHVLEQGLLRNALCRIF